MAALQTFSILFLSLLAISLICVVVVYTTTTTTATEPTILSGICNSGPSLLPDPVLCTVSSINISFYCSNTDVLYKCNTTCSCWIIDNTLTYTPITTPVTTPVPTTPTPIFSITCPPDVFMSNFTIFNNLTDVPFQNATYIAEAPCSGLTLTYINQTYVEPFYKRSEERETPLSSNNDQTTGPIDQIQPPPSIITTGYLMTHSMQYTNNFKRSVTHPLDWSANVGYFNSTTNFSTSFDLQYRMGYASVATDGVYKYTTNIGFHLNRLLQHDYYDMNRNVKYINIGENFDTSSICYIGNDWLNTTHYPRRMRRDSTTNRITILYVPLDMTDNATTFCVVISNTSDLFGGGSVGYEIPITYPARGLTRLDIGLYGKFYKVSFDALREPMIQSVTVARYGNAYYIDKLSAFSGSNQINMTSALQIFWLGRLQFSVSPVHNNGDCTIVPNDDFLTSSFVAVQTQGLVQYLLSGFSVVNFVTGNLINGVSTLLTGPSILNLLQNRNNTLLKDGTTYADLGDRSLQSACGKGGRIVGVLMLNNNNNLTINSRSVIFGVGPLINYSLEHPDIDIFGTSIAFLANSDIFVAAFYQVSRNASLQIPSVNYMYFFNNVARNINFEREFNGLANPQQLTLINNTNLISVGLDVVPNKFEFTISGLANSVVPGEYSMINQNIIIQGEIVTRTFTLSDSCQSVSCNQTIYFQTTNYTGP